jgi:hypothetical protein
MVTAMRQRKINRRAALLGLSGAVVSTLGRAAATPVGPMTSMGLPSRASVNHPAIVRQKCPEWCWAASASMIFAMHGHPINQSRIVSTVFGSAACVPAGITARIAGVLSSSWMDDGGSAFQANVIAAFDPANGVNAIDNAIIVNELAQNRPLLYCNTQHAMVVVSVDYYATPMGPNVQEVTVLDPWPYSPAAHPLQPVEMVPNLIGGQMTFLAAVQVTP